MRKGYLSTRHGIVSISLSARSTTMATAHTANPDQ